MKVVDEWVEVLLGELVKVEGGFAFKSSDFADDGIPVVRMSDLDNGHLNLSEAARIKLDRVKSLSKFKLHVGDYLIGMSGSINSYAIVRENDLPAYLNQRVGRFRLLSDRLVDYGFITQVARSNSFELHVKLLAAGAAQVNISPSQIESFRFSLPSKPEQAKIAEILSTVDRAIEQTEALIAKQQRIKTGLMQDLLTRGIDEQGNLRSEETHEFKDSPLGRIPVEWEVRDISSICLLVTDGKHGDCADEEGSGYYFISAKDIVEGQIDYSEAREIMFSDFLETHRRTNLQPGDVVMSNAGTIGRVAVPTDSSITSRTTFQKSVAVIKPHRTVITGCYLASYFVKQNGMLQNLARGSSQKNLLLGDLCAFKVLLPSLTEQHRINSVIAKIEMIKSGTNSILTKLRSLKTALMQDLLTGKVRVTALLKGTD